MESLSSLLAREFLGNSVRGYLVAGITLLLLLFGAKFLRWFLTVNLEKLTKRTATDFDDFIVSLLGTIRTHELALLALFIAVRHLAVSPAIFNILHIALVLAMSWRGAAVLRALLGYGLRRACDRAGLADANASSAAKNLELVLSGAIWVGAVLFILDNLGVNITAAVAGLGIGGVAVALAAQHILGDLFSSFVIFIDKPFKVGDFITVGDLAGPVEHIGIKTTRVRALSGEMLIFSNSDLTSARIRNYELMRERRVLTGFSLDLATPVEKAAVVPDIVKDAVKAVQGVRFDRAHLKGFGPAGLEFEFVYYVLSADYVKFMNAQENIDLGLLRRLEASGLHLAYPAQTVHLLPK
ncbi:MAG: mechanosensitive ion channel family protein [Elusimicrobiota bacterium]